MVALLGCSGWAAGWTDPASARTMVGPGTYRIQDGAQPRQFELALDELYVLGPGRAESLTVPARASARDMIAHAARLRQTTAGARVCLVLYEAGRPRNEYTRRVVTGRLTLQARPGADVAAIAAAAGASRVAPVATGGDFFVLEIPGAGDVLQAAETLRARADVLLAEPILARQQARRWVPNDPLFNQQWHLLNKASGGVDLNVTNAWSTYRGAGVVIGIVDDGLETGHPDLAANVNTTWDYDFNDFDQDPRPLPEDAHGSCCAGLAAGRGNNSLGICGVAPEATLVGLRLIAAPEGDDQEAIAELHSNQVIQLKNNSWGPADDGSSLEGPGPLTRAALEAAAWQGRNGRGTILLWAAGNGGDMMDNANFDGYANSMYTIAIGAVSNKGQVVWYSEPGACIVVCAPGGGGTNRLVTTDLTGEQGYNTSTAENDLADRDYTKRFQGTSASTPVAAGAVALMLQANTNLGWRDVQEILMRTARQVDAGGPGWRTNAAGFRFNHNYGAGMVNAGAAINLARVWTNLGPRSCASVESNFSLAVPDNNSNGVSRILTFTGPDLRLEHVQLTVDATHKWRGDLGVRLVSPGGYTSVLATVREGDGGVAFNNWTFMTVHHWGENSTGNWRVVVADPVADYTGTWTRARLDWYGVPRVATPPVFRPLAAQLFALSNAASFVVVAEHTNAQPVVLSASNLPPGAAFYCQGGTGVFAWAQAAPLGVYTSAFFAGNNAGVVTQQVIITVAGPGTFGFQLTRYVMEERFPWAYLDVDRTDGAGGMSLVSYSTRDASALAASDYTGTNGTLQFFSGGTNRLVEINGVDDLVAEGPEYFLVSLSNAFPGAVGGVSTAVVVIVDDDILTTQLSADFSGTSLPAGWSVTNAPGMTAGWRFDNPGGRENYTGGTGNFAVADSYYAGELNINSSLLTPVLDLRSCLRVELEFRSDFYVYSGYEIADIDLSVNGKAGPWTNVWRAQYSDFTGFDLLDLSDVVAGRSNVVVRFRYYDAYYDNWWELDDIRVRGEVDADGDRMPDWWEQQVFGSLTNTAGADRDGDGANNLDEYIAGTHPTNVQSRLEVVGIRKAEPLALTFQGSPFRTYSLFSATNLVRPNWETLGTNVGGAVWIDASLPDAAPQRVYRLQANPP